MCRHLATHVRAACLAMSGVALALAASPAAAQRNPATEPSPLAIFGVPLGGTLADVEAMAQSRGYRPHARPQYCNSGEYCLWRANVENFPGTEFLADLQGFVKDDQRVESFRFYFTAPPNEPRIWSAGLDQRFGDWFRPSAAAPLARDTLAAIRSRFGASSYEEGTLADTSNRGSGMEMIWFWDSAGRLIRPPAMARHVWPRAAAEAWNNCQTAMAQAKVTPGDGLGGIHNIVATNPKPLVLARSGNCARGVRVEIGQTRGHMHRLHIRMIDFKAGHDALFHTTKLVNERRAASNQARSATNRPDF